MGMQRQFKLKPSCYLAAVLILAHGVMVIALFPLALPIWAKTTLASLLLFNLAYHLRCGILLSAPSACVALTLEDDGVMLTTRAGEHLAGQMLHGSVVTPFLTVLNVLPQGARVARCIVILPDSLDAESFRQMRVFLKWRSGLKRQPFI